MKKIIAVTAILVAISVNAHAITSSLKRIESKVNKVAVTNVTNDEAEPKVIRIVIEKETISLIETNDVAFFKLITENDGDFSKEMVAVKPFNARLIIDGAGDCSKAIKVFPNRIYLKPKESQMVKIISKKSGYCRIFFESENGKPEELEGIKAVKEEETEAKSGVAINVRFRMGIRAIVE